MFWVERCTCGYCSICNSNPRIVFFFKCTNIDYKYELPYAGPANKNFSGPRTDSLISQNQGKRNPQPEKEIHNVKWSNRIRNQSPNQASQAGARTKFASRFSLFISYQRDSELLLRDEGCKLPCLKSLASVEGPCTFAKYR